MYILYRIFTDRVPVGPDYWYEPEFFSINTDTRQYDSLEWTLDSPPAFHTFNQLPFIHGVRPKLTAFSFKF
jgi:heme/copper-type cytochrome/quinol oxidase subunit 1